MLSAKRLKLNNHSWPILLLCVITLCTQGCVAPIAAVGATGSAAASSAGTAVVSTAAAYPVTATSLASSAVTGKSPLEHAASAATKKECNFLNPLDSKPICVEITIPPVTDKSTPLLGPDDPIPEGPKQ
jgi:hypothetical protein